MRGLGKYFDERFDIYYSGVNVEVFIENTLVEECTMIGWKTLSTQGPAFAYNRELFSTILHGKFHVEGQIAVNYVTTGYLEYIIAKSKLETQMQLGMTTFRNPERLVQKASEIDRSTFNAFKKNPDVVPTTDVKDSLRNYLWGNKGERVESLPGEKNKSVQHMLRNHYFNMLIVFGNVHGKNYTMRTIVNAKIIGDAMEVVNDGAPIQMIYSFVAQKADAPITPEAPVIEIPIGQKLPLYKIPDYIQQLGENIVQKNIAEPVGDTRLFLPVRKRLNKFNSYVLSPDDRIIPCGASLVPVRFSSDAEKDILVNIVNEQNVFSFTTKDTQGIDQSLSEQYDIEEISPDERRSLHTLLADNIVGTVGQPQAGTGRAPTIPGYEEPLVYYGADNWQFKYKGKEKYIPLNVEGPEASVPLPWRTTVQDLTIDKDRYERMVLEVQWGLVLFTDYSSYNEGEEWGKFSLSLELAVKEFQVRYGLNDDGKVGKDTITKMDELISPLYKIENRPLNPIYDALMLVPPVLSDIVDLTVIDTKTPLKNITGTPTSVDTFNSPSILYLFKDQWQDPFMFLFTQPQDEKKVKHFDFELKYSDKQKDVSHCIGQEDFPMQSDGSFIAIPKLYNGRQVACVNINDKPFVKAIESYVQVVFEETWADGLFLTGVPAETETEKMPVPPTTLSDMERAVTKIGYDNSLINQYAKESMAGDFNVFEGLDDIQIKKLYHNDVSMSDIGNVKELYVFPLRNKQLSETPNMTDRPFLMHVTRQKVDNSGEKYTFTFGTNVYLAGVEWYEFGDDDIIDSEISEEVINSIKANYLHKGKDVVLEISEFAEEGDIRSFAMDLLGDQYDFLVNSRLSKSAIMLNDLNVKLTLWRRKMINYIPYGDWEKMGDPSLSFSSNNIYIDWQNEPLKIKLFLSNNPFTDELVNLEAITPLIRISAGWPIQNVDDVNSYVYKATLEIEVSGDQSDVIVYSFPKTLYKSQMSPSIGYVKMDPQIKIDGGNFKALMLPMPIFGTTIDLGQLDLGTTHFFSIDNVYILGAEYEFNKTIDASDKFLGALYPLVESGSLIGNIEKRVINQLYQSSIDDLFGYGKGGAFEEYDDSPYSHEYELRKEYIGGEQRNWVIAPELICPAICVFNSDVDLDDALKNGIFIGYSKKTALLNKEVLGVTYGDGSKMRILPGGLCFMSAEEKTSREPEWVPSKVYIQLDINIMANELEKRYQLKREAAMSLMDIKKKLREGIKIAANAPDSPRVSVNMYNGTFWEQAIDAGKAVYDATAKTLHTVGSVLTFQAAESIDGIWAEDYDAFVVTLVAQYNL